MKPTRSQLEEEQYEEKRELVYQEYARSLDLEVALAIVPLSVAEVERLQTDEELLARVAVCDARVKADLIEKLRCLAESDNEGIRRAAIADLGEMFYPKRFRRTHAVTFDKPLKVMWEEVAPAGDDDEKD